MAHRLRAGKVERERDCGSGLITKEVTMEILQGAIAVFVCVLIAPAFLIGFALAAAIPVAGLGFALQVFTQHEFQKPEAPAGESRKNEVAGEKRKAA